MLRWAPVVCARFEPDHCSGRACVYACSGRACVRVCSWGFHHAHLAAVLSRAKAARLGREPYIHRHYASFHLSTGSVTLLLNDGTVSQIIREMECHDIKSEEKRHKKKIFERQLNKPTNSIQYNKWTYCFPHSFVFTFPRFAVQTTYISTLFSFFPFHLECDDFRLAGLTGQMVYS